MTVCIPSAVKITTRNNLITILLLGYEYLESNFSV